MPSATADNAEYRLKVLLSMVKAVHHIYRSPAEEAFMLAMHACTAGWPSNEQNNDTLEAASWNSRAFQGAAEH